MNITIRTPSGETPKIAPHLIGDESAQIATNCNLIRGDIRAFKETSKDEAISLTSCASLYKHTENSNDHWVVSANDIDYAKSPISDDQYERAYFTGETEPRFFANDNVSVPFDSTTDYYKLGIPAPTAGPTVISDGGGATYKGYVYSYVNSYGDEGPPSDVGSDDDFSSSILIEDIVAAPADRAIDKIYLYRTNATADGVAEFQFVLEATWFSASEQYEVGDYVIYLTDLYWCDTAHGPAAWDPGHFTAGDGVADADLLSVFPKTNYDPPDSSMTGLVSLPNGTFAGFFGNTLCFSEPFYPHAWPPEYQISFDNTLVGLGVKESTVIVLTDGNPYEVYGSHPSSMSKIKAPYYYPCISKTGIVSDRGLVAWPTNEGIAAKVAATDSEDGYGILTEKILSESDWAELSPSSLVGCLFQGKYFGFDSVTDSGFILDFTNGSYVPISVYAHAYHVEDGLYLVVDDTAIVDENNPPANMPLCVSEWNADDNNYLLYTFRSKEFQLGYQTNFSSAYIVVDQAFYDSIQDALDLLTLNSAIFAAGLTGALGIDGPLGGGHELGGDELYTVGTISTSNTITFKLYADYELKFEKTISSATNRFRLPGGYATDNVYFEISGYIPVKRVTIATSMDEI